MSIHSLKKFFSRQGAFSQKFGSKVAKRFQNRKIENAKSRKFLRKIYVDFSQKTCKTEFSFLSLQRLRITGNVEERPANVGQRYCKVLGRHVGFFLAPFIV